MYAIVKTGGKQVKVEAGSIIRAELLRDTSDKGNNQKLDKGAKVTLGEVLMIVDGDKVSVGTPLLSGASVAAEVVEQTRDEKITVFKKRRRQNYRRKLGHKQHITVLKITGISAK